MRRQDLVGRAESAIRLPAAGSLLVDGLDDLLTAEAVADAPRGVLVAGGGPHRQVIRRSEVEAHGGAVREERHAGGRRFERRADYREGLLRGRLDDLQEPTAREFIAVVQTQRGVSHGRLENSGLAKKFHRTRCLYLHAIGPLSHETYKSVFQSALTVFRRVA